MLSAPGRYWSAGGTAHQHRGLSFPKPDDTHRFGDCPLHIPEINDLRTLAPIGDNRDSFKAWRLCSDVIGAIQ